MQDEINQRLSDINRISQQTDFNGVKVLSANAKPLTLQVGANDGENHHPEPVGNQRQDAGPNGLT